MRFLASMVATCVQMVLATPTTWKDGASAEGRRRKSVSREVVDVPECRVVLLPDHPPVGGGPNLPAAQRVGPPASVGRFVQQDDLAWRKPGRTRNRHRVRPFDGIGGQLGRADHASRVIRSTTEDGRAYDD